MSCDFFIIFQLKKERVRNPLSFFGSKDSGNDDTSSQDWGGDFSSENGSGFDNFGSSDDGSRSTSFNKNTAAFIKTLSTPRAIGSTVPPFETNFGVSDKHRDFNSEEGFEAVYKNDSAPDATSTIFADINEVGRGIDRQKKKKKGLKGLFGKSEKI